PSFSLLPPPPPRSTLFPYTTLFRSSPGAGLRWVGPDRTRASGGPPPLAAVGPATGAARVPARGEYRLRPRRVALPVRRGGAHVRVHGRSRRGRDPAARPMARPVARDGRA